MMDVYQLEIEIEQTSSMLQTKQETAEKLIQIESDIKKMNEEFYCDICDKQYKNVAEVEYSVDSLSLSMTGLFADGESSIVL